jgi:hypothetical protein
MEKVKNLPSVLFESKSLQRKSFRSTAHLPTQSLIRNESFNIENELFKSPEQ